MPAPGPGKKLCGAQRPNQAKGVTCKRVAGHGTDHLGTGRCSRHGGSTRSHVASARELQARAAATALGVRIEIDPGEGLLQCVWDAAGMAEWYRARVTELDAHPGEGQVIEHVGGQRDGEKEFIPAAPAMYAPTYHANGSQTGRAEPHIFVRLWAEERDRFEHASKAALDAGVAQRLLDLAEDTARRLADGFIAFAVAMGQDVDDPAVKAAMRTALEKARGSAIDGTATEISA